MSSLPRDSSPSGLDAGTGAHFAEEALHTPSDLPDDISAPTAAMQRGKTDSTAGKGRWRRGRLGGGGGLGRMSGLAQTHLLSHVAWVVPVLRDWAKMKPVLRSALAAWLCMLCMIIRPIEVALGTASFLILVGIFIQPCELPFVAIIEREFFTLLLTAIGWAYANFAIFLAHLARNSKFPAELVEQEIVYSGGYIEAGPTAICTVFLAVGVAALLYLKVKFGPSPFLFASILGCISLDITLVYAPLYPYPIYILGQSVIVPLALKAAIAVAVSCTFFPKSVNSSFVERMLTVLAPIAKSSTLLLDLYKQSPTDADFAFDTMRKQVTASEAGLVALRGSARLLTREVSFGLANGEDLKSLVQLFVAVLAPADGISYYFSSIKADMQGMDIHMHSRTSKFNTPIPTRPGTPTHSAPRTPTGEQRQQHQQLAPPPHHQQHADEAVATASSSHIARHRMRALLGATPTRPDSVSSSRRHSHELRHRMQSAFSALHWRQPALEPVEVGLWESLRYAALETQLHSRRNDRYTELCFRLLGQVSLELLQQQAEAMASVQAWLQRLNRERFGQLRNALLFSSTKQVWPSASAAEKMEQGQKVKRIGESIESLEAALREFKVKKYIILEPFRSSVERLSGPDDDDYGGERIPHRYLFQCFTFCYFEAQFTARLLAFMREIQRIEEERTHWRFWFPSWPKLLTWDAWRSLGDTDHDSLAEHDEDPDQIPGMVSSLGRTKARDPEALDSEDSSVVQTVGRAVSRFLHQVLRGNSLFMVKAGTVTVLVALPSLLKSSAGWAYQNKAIWVVIMAQLSMARHRGEVLFSLFSRVIATLSGAVLGMLIWYIASGNGVANPYAMAAVTGFGFIVVMLVRLHLPGPPITAIITCVTTALVVGYSWQDSRNPTFGSPGIGWDIAWRRFLEVVIGATAAYIMAILPPSSSMRKYFRLSHATAIGEIGGMYCRVVTLAASPSSVETKETINQLIAIRTKVRRLMMLKVTISYEWSLRGRWPLKRYEELEEVELQLSRLLTHAVTICENLGPVYSRALLRRTHFLDPIFLADCIAILTMCTTALRTSRPLPQIVPVLIDRYLANAHGFQFRAQSHHGKLGDDASSHHAAFDDDNLEELPKIVTFETICKEEYQTFAVGVLVAYGIVVRLDRLCLAVKALVGETYSVPTDLHFADYHH